jgi:hypothetical protein
LGDEFRSYTKVDGEEEANMQEVYKAIADPT